MRPGVLDVGSNAIRLLVVDAYCGAHPPSRTSEEIVLPQLLASVARMPSGGPAAPDGAGSARSPQSVSGGPVAEGVLRALSLEELAIRSRVSPQEVILRWPAHANGDDHAAMSLRMSHPAMTEDTHSDQQIDKRIGRKAQHGARWSR